MTSANMTAIDRGSRILDAINRKDAVLALKEVQSFQEMMKDVNHGAEYVTWLLTPANLTAVHQGLISCLGVSPRQLAIKRVSVSKTLRAVLLVRAIEISINKVVDRGQ